MSESVAPVAGVSLPAVVAGNIRAETARRGFRQSDVARAVSLSPMAVSDRYRGRTPWSLDEVDTVARWLGVPVAALLIRPETTRPALRSVGR